MCDYEDDDYEEELIEDTADEYEEYEDRSFYSFENWAEAQTLEPVLYGFGNGD